MTYYPTTLLPLSPPYTSIDDLIFALCDACILINYNFDLSQNDHDQHFEYTMAIIDFWEEEAKEHDLYGLQ